MKNKIHPSAIIENGAKIADNVEIGAFSIIGANVEIGAGSIIKSHVVIDAVAKIGKNNIIFPFACIGQIPQDLKYKGEKSQIIIGDNNKIREYVTIHPGTENGGMVTQIGNNCLFMIGAHIAHDCKIGDNVIMANNATLAGHVEVGDFAVLGGLCAVHQFVKIGQHAMIGGLSGVENNIIPYSVVMGERAFLAGLNLIGLKRRGFKKEDINILRSAYKKLFTKNNLDDLKQEFADQQLVLDVINFMQAENSRAICQPKNKNFADEGDLS